MPKPLYKVTFLNAGKVYELYARHVASGALWGFTEIGELVFDVHEGVVVDPTEERLRDEFGGTKVLHLPMHSIVRIDADHVLDLRARALGIRGRQVHLVQDGQDLDSELDRRVAVGHRLGLDAL